MAQKSSMKQKDMPKIGGRPVSVSAPKGAAAPARRVAAQAPATPQAGAQDGKDSGGFLTSWFAKPKPEDAMTENLAAVKTGVLQELETLSAQKGMPVTGSPFSTIVLPPRAKPQRGLKWVILCLFLILFMGIMFLAGQRPHMDMDAGLEARVGPGTPVAATPISRQDVQTQVVANAPLLKVLGATRVDGAPDSLVLTLALGNLGQQDVPAGPLHLAITDAAGQTLKQATLALDEPLAAGQSRKQTWTIPLDATRKLDRFVATVPLAALQVHLRPGE